MIPQPLPLIFPVLAAGLAGWLKDVGLSKWANYAIVSAAFIVAVALSIILGGGLTGDPGKDISIIIAECSAIFALMKPLMDKATTAVSSPFSKIAMRREASQRAAEEELAAWRAATSSVPPRASAPPPPPPGVVDGAGRALYSQPGFGTWSESALPTSPYVDAPTSVDIPAIPPRPSQPPMNPC